MIGLALKLLPLLGKLKPALAKLFGLLSLVVVGFVFGMTVNRWRYSEEIAQLQAVHAQVLQNYSEQARVAAAAALAQQHEAEQAVAEIDRRYTEELAHAQEDIERLRADLAVGARRLRVNATCPEPSTGVPDAAPAAGVDDAAGARLAESAEQDYLRVIDRVTLMQTQLQACQEYVRGVSR